VKPARAALAGFDGTVLVLYGDSPLITKDTLARLIAKREEARAAVAVIGFRPADPGPYGRLVAKAGALERIVEAKDASKAELKIGLCNSGFMAIDGRHLFDLIDRVDDKNAKREFYLTDIVKIARKKKLRCAYIEADEAELHGVNDRAELARAEAAMQDRLRRAAMLGGVTMTDPASVYLSHDTIFGRDVTIGPNVFFGAGVRVGDGAEIRANCHIDGATVGARVVVGPFARLRPGAVLETDVHIGNFVEVKAATLRAGAKANHLAYIGDAEVGEKSNIGAGTITCNYDGFLKHRTRIGRGVFVGTNASLVAPVDIGDGAIVGAGSVVTRDVAADALAVERSEQREFAGAARRFRDRKLAEKAAKKDPE
jgi:bifunctional UDP-N-acetylglucosamine pyrophosphorylase/glucosamine-1-phosphate N-acetyltransferase